MPNIIELYRAGGKLLLSVDQDAKLVLHEPDCQEEGAKIFWDHIQVHGQKMLDRLRMLEDQNAMLAHDPWRQASQDGYAVWDALSAPMKKRLTHVDVSAILEAVQSVAMRSVQ